VRIATKHTLAMTLRAGVGEKRVFLSCVSQAEAAGEVLQRFLHPNERARFEAFRFEPRRTEFLLGRYVAKLALGEFLGEADPSRIEIVPGIFRCPLVRHPSPELAAITITHSHGRSCALAYPATHPMGLDLERLDPARLDILKEQVTSSEWSGVAAAGELAGHTLLWTAKEALSKALQCGLMAPIHVFAIERVCAGNGEWTGDFTNFPQYKFQSAISGGFALSFVLPRETGLSLDWDWVGRALE
jgi:4'-phosphopantetheinyl transferase